MDVDRGHLKAGNTGTMPSLDHFVVLRLSVKNFDVLICAVISSMIFSGILTLKKAVVPVAL